MLKGHSSLVLRQLKNNQCRSHRVGWLASCKSAETAVPDLTLMTAGTAQSIAPADVQVCICPGLNRHGPPAPKTVLCVCQFSRVFQSDYGVACRRRK